jgi:hypothetical protein
MVVVEQGCVGCDGFPWADRSHPFNFPEPTDFYGVEWPPLPHFQPFERERADMSLSYVF